MPQGTRGLRRRHLSKILAIYTDPESTTSVIPVEQINFTLNICEVKPTSGQNYGGAVSHTVAPLITEVTNVHREVNKLIIHNRKENATRFDK